VSSLKDHRLKPSNLLELWYLAEEVNDA